MKTLIKTRISFYSFLLMAAWTIIISGLSVRETLYLHNETKKDAIAEADASFRKIMAIRQWSTDHGGVYVPVDAKTPPSKYLAHIPERDIKTPSGIQLTLMNPTYILRQISELYFDLYGIKGHTTSIKPLRPENAPDEWEKKTLLSFEKGIKENYDFTDIEGKPFLRFMRPLITEEACLKCHSHQGYKAGDIRGGISISVPMSELLSKEREERLSHLLWYLLLWIIGLSGIYMGNRKIKQRINERDRAYLELENYEKHLEALVKDRTAELTAANQKLEYLSLTDGLTGVANRRYFDELIQKEWKRAMRESRPIAFIMIDIDFFKTYNDLYGHQSGDECLKKVAMVLYAEMKRAGEFVARYGGEEFAVVLPNTDMPGAKAVAEAIKTNVNKLQISHAGSEVNDFVTVSLGVVSAIPEMNSIVEEFIMQADKSLYLAKKGGRNQINFASFDNKIQK